MRTDTIVALSTAPGISAIAVIRLSGKEAITITNSLFKGKDLSQQPSHTIHYGSLQENGEILDEVLISVFKEPTSFTKENIVEISCHGSEFIIQKIIKALIRNGARLAEAGEFTKRAFINGQFDLTQAEAIADLIHSDSEASHHAALNQMRGGFSKKIAALREQLIHFASLIELELDFGEEDVEFANRDDLQKLLQELLATITKLTDSFQMGNVIKNGVPTVIAGKPNAGKSTLLNALLNEEKAIVSDIPGTTRDFIEDEIHIEGIRFRFIDTAGLRNTTDTVEAIGVQRTKEKLKQASIIIYLFDVSQTTQIDLEEELTEINDLSIPYLLVGNKADQKHSTFTLPVHYISATTGEGIEELKQLLTRSIHTKAYKASDTIVTNLRHYQNLKLAQDSLSQALSSLSQGITGDLLAMDIRQALFYLGQITGEITTDDLLSNIFSKFCIGK
ncbi:tRNA uridine-5-carboxymethylaminomethyl(34) synthesis GTPase MnmE [Xanthocytophaga agilis]|uniref:tRNA modification GTPase MnmE n=1 Tax=Xanthocytophaga agilis TaxID=3048010 RepID=A0AAE3UE45_9BACT|nr:tRNA uridine-5-carboxymethylaminomethyl(34) synthesis GTPase MnmE [Xanthocytophaga agilis]MDJ1499877.1 tRNA uridine-5-carboxymethylaminomethyl(34) synthesis GTPase MnmE [Xanthocytophaga agilis]